MHEAPKFRVICAAEAGFPAFYRLVWREHVREFSDLDKEDRMLCMEAVTAVEQGMRELLAPSKINLATLGNVVPHLHWHVIARYDWDSHFPGPVWAGAQRERAQAREAEVAAKLPALETRIIERLRSI
ncbi:HIT family protein [Variovorax sp. OV329]|uniref:HIT family protein n=1 Tax=Variovorax sp. OV329 TaxID=1882825 RepID=UPI0008F17B13|nr:HIT family protein [Variovorax sp. OV329]SFM07233.1 Diadenosine tetraphosphate (Ap4A) hydrolase [Variovorax sp. OV329]